MVTRSHSAPGRARERAALARDALSPLGPPSGRRLPEPVRNRAEPGAQLPAGNFREGAGPRRHYENEGGSAREAEGLVADRPRVRVEGPVGRRGNAHGCVADADAQQG